MKKVVFLFFLLNCLANFGQLKDTIPNITDDYFLVKDGDTLMLQLKEVLILPKHKFKSKVDTHYYYWFRRKVF